MKLMKAIAKIDSLKQNTYDRSEKIAWLSELDGMVKRQIIDTHEGGSQVPFSGYDLSTPDEQELLVSAPFAEMYLLWLEGKIDYYNGDYTRFNNAMTLFDAAYKAFGDDYTRTHIPLGTGGRFR